MSARRKATSSPAPVARSAGRLGASVAIVRKAWAALAGRMAESFAVDLRSLAVFRIGLGLAILADAMLALGNAEMFLSDEGFMPRTLLYERHWPSVASWSFHALSGAVQAQVFLLVLQMLAALWLIAGWRTRIATVVCWVLVCSLETRNPTITNGADAMTRLLLFWGMFLPLGARWSLDEWRARGGVKTVTHSLRSVAGAALLLQVAFVYWFSVLCKTHECWWGDGSALVQTLQLDLFARPLGVWLRGHADLCRWLTYGWLTVEALGPLLAFLPFWRTAFRLAVVALFVGFHAGIELTMDIGAFPFVMAVAWCAFLPGALWDFVARKRRAETRKNEVASGGDGGSDFRVISRVSRAANAFCLACIAFVFLWNLRGTNFSYWERFFPRSVNPVAFALRLDQHWSMFAPRPTSDDGWFVLRAGMSDGSEVDLLREGEPVDFDKPALISASFKDARWQKLITNLWLEQYEHLREPFGDAVARKWNATHGGLNQVVAWQLWLMLEPTLSDGSAGPVRPTLLFERERFESGASPFSSQEELRASSP